MTDSFEMEALAKKIRGFYKPHSAGINSGHRA